MKSGVTVPVICAGNLTLDVLVDLTEEGEAAIRAVAGGCAINVAQALTALGHRTYAVGARGNDRAGDILARALKARGVDTSLVEVREGFATQVIDHFRIAHRESVSSTFSTVSQGRFLHRPRFLDLTAPPSQLSDISKHRGIVVVDRLSTSIISMMQMLRERGWGIVLDLSTCESIELFAQAYPLCHLLKFSHIRLNDLSTLPMESAEIGIIHTGGEFGLNYRAPRSDAWRYVPAFEPRHLVDSVGAGDCLTGWILHRVIETFKPLTDWSSQFAGIESYLGEGQRVAAASCAYRGAVGLFFDRDDAFDFEVECGGLRVNGLAGSYSTALAATEDWLTVTGVST